VSFFTLRLSAVRLIRREAYISLTVTLAVRFSVLPAVHSTHAEPDTSGVLLAKRRPSRQASLFTLSLLHLGPYFSPGFFHPAKHASCRQASFVSTIVFCYTESTT
jgi:hypothetical protein